ncbi:hypothetical protein, partial [Streptomyces eurythermus]
MSSTPMSSTTTPSTPLTGAAAPAAGPAPLPRRRLLRTGLSCGGTSLSSVRVRRAVRESVSGLPREFW